MLLIDFVLVLPTVLPITAYDRNPQPAVPFPALRELSRVGLDKALAEERQEHSRRERMRLLRCAGPSAECPRNHCFVALGFCNLSA